MFSGGGYPRPDNSWVVVSCHASIRPASRAHQQMRVFSFDPKYYPADRDLKPPPPSFIHVQSALKDASVLIKDNYSGSPSQYEKAREKIQQGLDILEEVAAITDNCAKELLLAVVQPIIADLDGLDHGARCSIVKASLSAIWKLLQTAPPHVETTLRTEISSKEVKSRMEKIIRDNTGRWDYETRNHAREILRTTTQVYW